VCAAIEREIEQARLDEHKPWWYPQRAVHSYMIEHLFRGGTRVGRHGRATRLLRRMHKDEKLVKPVLVSHYTMWELTRKGYALAQEGELWCRRCANPIEENDLCLQCLIKDVEWHLEMATGMRELAEQEVESYGPTVQANAARLERLRERLGEQDETAA
jgi:hypothetical protein